jgi:hypothetical protein
MAKKNNVYKVPRSAFLKLWHTIYHDGGSLNDLVKRVRAEYDSEQKAIAGEMPKFDDNKCKQKCDRIIAYAENNKMTAPERLPGHESLKGTLDDLEW